MSCKKIVHSIVEKYNELYKIEKGVIPKATISEHSSRFDDDNVRLELRIEIRYNVVFKKTFICPDKSDNTDVWENIYKDIIEDICITGFEFYPKVQDVE